MLVSEHLHHVDDACIVAVKPAGLLAVPGRGADKADCLIARVQVQYPDASIVHRLDQATSGLMVLARSKAHESHLSRQFQQRSVTKHYIAVVDGLLAQDDGDITLPLLADWPNRPRQKVDHDSGKPSHTSYRVLERDTLTTTTRVLLTPHTGRSHQLRVHLLSLGHPIVGDTLYGSRPAPRLMLHATHLGFTHPQTGMMLAFDSPPEF
jgi:tRNA pseudouridine32 synthase / 23S rRNA pseudouridine746 synthase